MDQEARYKQFRDRYNAFLLTVWPGGHPPPQRPILTTELYAEACRLFYDITDISKCKGFRDIPDEACEAYQLLKKYIAYAINVAADAADAYANPVPAMTDSLPEDVPSN
jgi:hypothetical protein